MYRQVIIASLLVLAVGISFSCASVDIAPTDDQQYEKSREQLKQLPQASAFSKSLYQAGMTHYQAGAYQQAIDTWRKAITAGGEGWYYLAQTHYNIALCYVAIGRNEWAIGELQKSIAVQPDYYEAHYSLANLYITEKMYEKAAAELKVCTDLRGDDSSLFYTMGVSYLNAGMYPESVGALSTYLFLEPGNDQALNSLELAHRGWGLQLYGQGQFEKAIEKFGVALRINDQNGKTYYNIARCYLQMGAYDRAIEAYRRAHQLAPDLATEERNALLDLATQGQGDAEGYIKMGDLYTSKGLFEKAAVQYELAVSVKPDDIDRYLKLARFYAEMLNDRVKAVRWYGAFVAMAPNDPRVAMIRKEIAKESAPPPDPDKKPTLVSAEAGLEYNSAEGIVIASGNRFNSGARVYRVAVIGDLWGKHSVVKRAIMPDGKVLYEENITKEFFVDRFTFVSYDKFGMRGTWKQHWIVDGVLIGNIDILIH